VTLRRNTRSTPMTAVNINIRRRRRQFCQELTATFHSTTTISEAKFDMNHWMKWWKWSLQDNVHVSNTEEKKKQKRLIEIPLLVGVCFFCSHFISLFTFWYIRSHEMFVILFSSFDSCVSLWFLSQMTTWTPSFLVTHCLHHRITCSIWYCWRSSHTVPMDSMS
jgi:hypothetical protein